MQPSSQGRSTWAGGAREDESGAVGRSRRPAAAKAEHLSTNPDRSSAENAWAGSCASTIARRPETPRSSFRTLRGLWKLLATPRRLLASFLDHCRHLATQPLARDYPERRAAFFNGLLTERGLSAI
jgi:hypothetical protein